MGEAPVRSPGIREDGLQLDEHRRFQERFWTVERIVWVAFGMLLVAALLGLTGSGGPLSRMTVTMAGGAIEFPRIARWESADDMVVHFAPGAGERRLTLSPQFAEALQVAGIQPPPVRTAATSDGVVMVFASEAEAPAEVTFHVTPLKPGLPTFEARIGDGAATAVTMLVLP